MPLNNVGGAIAVTVAHAADGVAANTPQKAVIPVCKAVAASVLKPVIAAIMAALAPGITAIRMGAALLCAPEKYVEKAEAQAFTASASLA